MNEPRYIILHGHFYQPPRESPWTGLIPAETSAAPFAELERADSQRVLHRECPCSRDERARSLHSQQLRSAQLRFRSDAARLARAPREERLSRDPRGDDASKIAHGGHGNAIAQAYNHSILPLLDARDRELQIAWGIEDFVVRFGHPARGDVAARMRRRRRNAARRWRRPESSLSSWRPTRDTSRRGSPTQRRPFHWRRDDLSLAVFRFDRELSRRWISFGDGLADGAGFADRSLAARARADARRSDPESRPTARPSAITSARGAAELARATDAARASATTSSSPIAPNIWRRIRAPAVSRSTRPARGVVRMASSDGAPTADAAWIRQVEPGMARAAARRDGLRATITPTPSTIASRRRLVTTVPARCAKLDPSVRSDPRPAHAEEFFVGISYATKPLVSA